MDHPPKIFVSGHKGLVGSAVVRALHRHGYANLLTRTRTALDLMDAQAVAGFLQQEKPDWVIMAAARVGGIHANNAYPAEFIYENLTVQNNLIHHAYRSGVKKLLFLGSSCIYPRDCPQPIREEYLLSAPLEPSNEPYAVAKIAGIKLCQAYRRQYGFNAICAMPTNLYGPGDNFHADNAHVLPALLRRFHQAKTNGDQSVAIWGSGRARREFLYVDDLADALVVLMERYDSVDIVNIGAGNDITIRELAEKIAAIVGFGGEICLDGTRPDGTPRKLLDTATMKNLGWSAQTSLEEGLRLTYDWYMKNERSIRT